MGAAETTIGRERVLDTYLKCQVGALVVYSRRRRLPQCNRSVRLHRFVHLHLDVWCSFAGDCAVAYVWYCRFAFFVD